MGSTTLRDRMGPVRDKDLLVGLACVIFVWPPLRQAGLNALGSSEAAVESLINGVTLSIALLPLTLVGSPHLWLFCTIIAIVSRMVHAGGIHGIELFWPNLSDFWYKYFNIVLEAISVTSGAAASMIFLRDQSESVGDPK
jgi:hypothetical protein